ncbi:MAG: tripartite tricarboxylate transporter TctB family protein [Desulfovibrionaceae bacterium]|nr:tripartite tricarboxylate transporter TctB family protein [Desulfovibrionaceae bacterium]
MTFTFRNLCNGLALAGVALILWTQTYGSENALQTEGIHPMDYPRFLIIFLFVLAILSVFKPGRDEAGSMPILTRRTVPMCLSFVLYALLFDVAGFAVSAFFGMFSCALIMGYKRYALLGGVCAAACACIWALFTYALKIPLPAGIFG